MRRRELQQRVERLESMVGELRRKLEAIQTPQYSTLYGMNRNDLVLYAMELLAELDREGVEVKR